MPIYALGPLEPDIAESAFVHPDAVIIGQVRSYIASARRYRAELRRLDPIPPNAV